MRINTIVLTLLLVQSIFGQTNGGFETNDADGCRNATGTSYTITPFNDNKVLGWYSSHGTPQINKVGCPSGENDVHSGTEAAFLHFDSTNNEGIFQDIEIAKDESFNITLYAKGPNTKVVIKFTSGLSNAPAGSGGNTQIPNPASQQLVIEKQLSNNWQEIRINEIIANNNYTQVWIYALIGSILVDDFSIKKSCCEPYKIWQNVINPPSTYVNNYILAGENVDATQNSGNVVITASSGPVVFQAGESIVLDAGFRTELGAQFMAEIKPCSQVPFTVIIDTLYGINSYCDVKFVAQACYGSGDYTYNWGSHSSNDPISTELIPLNQNQWVFLTVIDNIYHDTIHQNIYLYKKEFNGDFNINLYNVITPNGDGVNDEWVAIDSTRLGSDSFGYNAYEFSLEIFNRWGVKVYEKSKYNNSTGFSYNEISWLENACDAVAGSATLYGVLNLKNCDNDEDISFIIEVICVNTEPFHLNIDSTQDIQQIIVFPNPAINFINIYTKKETGFRAIFYDSKGAKLKEIVCKKNCMLDVENCSNGYYQLKILTDAGEIIEKVIFINK